MERDEQRARETTERDDSVDSPPTGEVRIDAPEAGVVAGIAAPSTNPTAPEQQDAPREVVANGEVTGTYELPHWADPPTGQVPRVLLEDPDAPEHNEPILRGPSWREDASDWDDSLDLSLLAPDAEEIAQIAGAGREATESPFSFAFDEVEDEETDQAVPWQPMLDDSSVPRRRRHAHRRRPVTTSEPVGARNGLVATATGVAFAGVAVACFLAGAAATLALLAVVLTIGAGEAYAALQRGGYRPATLIGVLAVPALVVGAYLRGTQAVVIITGIAALLVFVWFIAGFSKDEPIVDSAVSLLVICWVGVLGSFAGLLLAPSSYPHRHGIAFVLAAVLLTACYDVGAYVVGARLGKHRVFPRLSPSKSLEGLIGGTLLCLVVAAVGVSHLHPFRLGAAIELGVIVSVFAPLGDLFESLVKRDLSIKDIGSLLPAHGGVLDRIDAMLFVVVPTYFLVRLVHL